MIQVCVPDDSPSVLAGSEAWTLLQSFAEVAYFDTLPGSESTLIERIGTAPAVLNIRSSSRFTERVFAACPTLRLLSIWGTGTDHVDLAAAERYGVKVANTPGVSAISIAEHALALLLAVARQTPAMDASTRAGEWRRGHFVQLYGKTCGIIGDGANGPELARVATGIGMRVVGWAGDPDRHHRVALV